MAHLICKVLPVIGRWNESVVHVSLERCRGSLIYKRIWRKSHGEKEKKYRSSFFLWSLLLGAVLGSLTYGINWLYWFVKKKTLVLTPHGFIYFEQRSPRYVVKFRVVRSISFKTCDSDLFFFITDKILTVDTKLLTIEIKLNSFATPEAVAQHIDDAYTLFKTSQGFLL